MLALLLPTLLQFVAQAVPMLTTSVQIAGAIKTVAEAVPLVIETARDLAPSVKIAINAIRGSTATTAEQLDELDALEAKIDAAYDAASQKAKIEDDAADAAASKA